MSFGTFVGEAITNFGTVAAISPSSRFLATAMVEPLPLARTRIALELGAGTGAITHASAGSIAVRWKAIGLRDQSALLRLPAAKHFGPSCGSDQFECRKSRIRVAAAGLRTGGCGGILARFGVHARSSAPRVVSATRSVLASEIGIYPVSVHTWDAVRERTTAPSGPRPLLEKYFGAVQCRIVWRNLPPAFVFSCYAQTLTRQSPMFAYSPGS